MTAIDGPERRPGTDRSVAPTRSRAPWTRLALHLFPSAWQERYGAEFGALLDQTPPTGRVVFDVLVAAVDAHVHPTGPRRRWPLMIERLRISELVVFACWVVFVVAGLAFQRMTEGAPFAPIAVAQPLVGVPYAAIVAGAVVSLVAVVVGGVPVALAIARAALARRAWRQLGLLAVAPISLAIWIGLTLLLVSVGDPPADGAWRAIIDVGVPLLGNAAFLIWIGIFILAVIASTVAASAAALDAEIDASLYRRAAIPAVVTALAMVVVATAVVLWGIGVALVAPAIFWGSEGILGGSTALTWLGVVVAMGAAAAVAIRAAVRARSDLAA
jgi:hypothetical protein